MENSALLLNKFPLLSIYLMSLSRTTLYIGILKKSIVTYKFTLMSYFSIFPFDGMMVLPVILYTRASPEDIIQDALRWNRGCTTLFSSKYLKSATLRCPDSRATK